MYWHMDPEQLRQFTTASRPTDLPPQLTTQLPHRLRDFFRDKYGPAFIARSIAQFPDYRDRLTERERRKITYWWEGNVRNALVQGGPILTDLGQRERLVFRDPKSTPKSTIWPPWPPCGNSMQIHWMTISTAVRDPHIGPKSYTTAKSGDPI